MYSGLSALESERKSRTRVQIPAGAPTILESFTGSAKEFWSSHEGRTVGDKSFASLIVGIKKDVSCF